MDELTQLGMLTAIEIALRYDETLASFPTFVSPYATHAMIDSRKAVSQCRRRIAGSISDHLSRDGDDEAVLGHMCAALVTSEVLGLVDEAWPADRRMMRVELSKALEAARRELSKEEVVPIRHCFD